MQAGETAPDFELRNQDGEPVRLSDLRGRSVVLLRKVKPGEHDDLVLGELAA